MAEDTNRGWNGGIVEGSEDAVRFVGRYRDEVLATLLMVIGAALVVLPNADLAGGAMVTVGALAWASDWLAG